MPRDRLACGINDQTIQRKMLVEKDLTFKRALEIFEGTQAADQNYREMRAVRESQGGTSESGTRQAKRTELLSLWLPRPFWQLLQVHWRRHVENATRRGTWPECVTVHLESTGP